MPSTIPDKTLNKRLKPCQRCKIQRRKCDRPSEDVDCSRCIKSNRECINDDGGQDGEDDSVDGNTELQRLTAQVTSLQQNFQQLESHLLRSESLTQHMDWEETALASWNHRHHANNDMQSTSSSYSPLLLSPTLTASSSASMSSGSTINNGSLASIPNDGKEKKKDYQWDLTLVGGNLRLDSTIGSFEELIAYGHALQKYLSPFSGVFDNTAFLFETMQPQSLLPMVIQVVSLTSPSTTRRKKLVSGTSMISKYHFMLKRRLPEVLLAANGKPPPLSCIQELLQTYFTCFNPAFPLIHASSYYAEYESVIRHDPSQHALTMAICSMVSISTCRHVLYDNYERRILADYFYQRAVDLLVDFFDDPERRLESLMVINFISQYQQQTLRVADARKWCTIAFMIATDLEQEYKLHPRSTASASPSPSDPYTPASSPILSYPSPFPPSPLMSSIPLSPPPSEPALPSRLVQTTQNVDAAVFGRHYIMSLCCQKFLDLIVEGNPETWQFLNSKPILFIEDECDVSHTFIAFYNCALQFMCHPVVLEMKEQIHRLHLGETAKVTLELILRFDQVYQDWWKDIPAQFRLCDQDPVDVSCRPLIEKCSSQIQLIVFILAVSHKAEANLALTKPSNQSMISQGGNYQLIRAIQERALNEAYECIESLIIAVKMIDAKMDYCIFASDLLLVISDLLCTLAASSSVSVKKRSKQKLMESLYELRRVHFMEGNLVPPSLSPLDFMNSTTSPPTANANDLSPDILDMYSEYTFPCLAFGYDVIRKASEGD